MKNTLIIILMLFFYNPIVIGKYIEMINQLIENGDEFYDQDGNLTIFQRGLMDRESIELKIFFKSKLTGCDDDKNGMFFDILACVTAEGECPNGLKICYTSELHEKLVNDTKFIMNNPNEEYGCQDSVKSHSLYIDIKDGKANIISSIDTRIYTINLPEVSGPENLRCFKIKVGTEDSIKTQITYMNDTQINVDPPLPELDMKYLLENGWNKRENNFHLFSLDFIPKLTEWRKNYGDFYKSFVYAGSEEKHCNLTLQFIGEKIHRCYTEWIDTSMKCPGPYFVARNKTDRGRSKKNQCELNPDRLYETKYNPYDKINKCKFTMTKGTESTRKIERRDIMTSGNENEIQKYKKMQIMPYEQLSLARITDYENQIFKSKEYHEFGQGIQMEEGKEIEESFFWHMKVGKGCLIVVQELYVNCNGWAIKTGQFQFQARPIENDNLD